MSMAIKYAMQKQAKKSRGGACMAHGSSDCEMCHGGQMAEGGQVHDTLDFTSIPADERKGKSRAGVHVREANRQTSHGDRESDERAKRQIKYAKEEHHEVLRDLKESKKPNLYAEGGFVEEEEQSGYEDMPEDDMISRIMKQRYSKGGMVSNDTPVTADFEDNQFDDLVKDDDLESSYTGKNSGDEIGNEKMDEDDRDLIARIMKSRRSKDRMPQPM